LLNAIQTPPDKESYVRSRQFLFKSVFHLYQENKLSDVKASNLYTVLYSKYFTKRFIIMRSEVEDDDAIKDKFRQLMDNPDTVDAQEFNDKYLGILKELKSPEDFLKFKELDERMTKDELYEDEIDYFYHGARQTDIHLQEKLGEDVFRFIGKRDRVIGFLKNYRFVNGWIIAAGVVVLSVSGPILVNFF
jgi:hypothetical protein